MDETDSINAITGPVDPAFPSVVSAGKAPAAGFLGIVMLDTRFPRPPGDIGNAQTWTALGIAVDLHVVKGIWPDKVVQSAAGLRSGRILPSFVTVARQLERRGARAITTSCGFLALLQKELQAAVKVPLITSSLMQLPRLLAVEQQVGVLTISAGKLGKEHLRSAGVPRERLADVLVQGMDPKGEFATRILGNQDSLDVAKAEQEAVSAAVALKARAPGLKHLVLECTNLPPYRQAIEAATGLKTWALTDDERLLKPFSMPLVPNLGPVQAPAVQSPA